MDSLDKILKDFKFGHFVKEPWMPDFVKSLFDIQGDKAGEDFTVKVCGYFFYHLREYHTGRVLHSEPKLLGRNLVVCFLFMFEQSIQYNALKDLAEGIE